MVNRKRNQLDEAFDDAMDTRACLLEAQMAEEEEERWRERRVKAQQRIDMHNRAVVARLEALRRQPLAVA